MTEIHLEKKIKKNIYGKLQSIQIIFPPGFGTVALEEVQTILNNLWFAKKSQHSITLLANEIRVYDIHMFAIVELLIRNQCLTDIRLIIFEGKAYGKNIFEKKCADIPWDFYLNKSMSVRIRAKSIASKAFHESALKQILSTQIENLTSKVVSGEKAEETTSIYIDYYKEKLTISISLAGNLLYKRGYREVLSASAPLREDVAMCCIRRALQYAKDIIHQDFLPDTVLIPFSGTGTFAFEFIQLFFNFSPVLSGREYAIEKMPLFKRENFNYLVKKAKENFLKSNENNVASHFKMVCIDNSNNANASLAKNSDNFANIIKLNEVQLPINWFLEDDFLEVDMDKLVSGNVFILLNPPYGLRLGKNLNSVAFYKKIANKLNETSRIVQKDNKQLLGFILCPSEETWLAFCHSLKDAKMNTYHFTQGGMDIRVCQFLMS